MAKPSELPVSFKIGDRSIGEKMPCFVIAEAGVNHNGDPELAHKLIDAAAQVGADAVKFQTFRSELLVQVSAESAQYQQRNGGSRTQLELLSALELPISVLHELSAHAQERNILFFSTPFDESSAEFLAELNVPAIKIGSGDLTSERLLKFVAKLGKPILLSTGMSYLEEVEAAVELLCAGGAKELALFHCVSCYPAHSADANLRAVDVLRTKFNIPVGYSDHHQSNLISIAAVARGAALIEKHLTLDRNLPGPDHSASSDPKDFADLVRSIRDVEASLGSGQKIPASSEQECRIKGRRSIVTTSSIKRGTKIDSSMLTNKRPGTGIPPRDENLVVGRVAAVDIAVDSVLSWEMLEKK